MLHILMLLPSVCKGHGQHSLSNIVNGCETWMIVFLPQRSINKTPYYYEETVTSNAIGDIPFCIVFGIVQSPPS